MKGYLKVKKMDVKELAIGIISYCNNNNIKISNSKLQKILYYIQGYAIKKTHEPAFDAEIHSWQYGPVIKEVYFEYNQFCGRDIVLDNKKDRFFKEKNTINNIVLKVLDSCKNRSSFELVEMTRKEDPWKKTYHDKIIKLDIMNEYFSNNDPLKIEKKA